MKDVTDYGFKIWWDEEKQILRETTMDICVGVDEANQVVDLVFGMLDKYPGAPILVNPDTQGLLTQQAAKIFLNAYLDKRVTKVALLNPSKVIQMDISFFVKTFAKSCIVFPKIKICKTEEEAFEWFNKSKRASV